jgi:parvulin-like peptidyl-prolyl isomerase
LTLDDIRDSYGEEVWNKKSREQQREIINQWVNLTILAHLAQGDDIIGSDKSLKFIAENAGKKVYANAIVSQRLKTMNFTDEELFNYYRLHQAEFVEGAREYKIQRIFFRHEPDMRRINRMLDAREINFNPAAERFSEEQIGRNGGFVNAFVTKTGPDSLVWVELNKVDKLQNITMPYRNGWIIVRYTDHRESTVTSSFFDVRDEIEERIRESRKSELYELLLREARHKSSIVFTY